MAQPGLLISADTDASLSRAFATQDVAAGATSLGVTSGVPFATGAGAVMIAGTRYVVSGVVLPEDEESSATLSITPGLVGAIEAGQPIDCDPFVESTYAFVQVAGDEETVRVLVPQEMQDQMSLTLGPHVPPEAVEFEDRGRGYELTWVEGRVQRDGSAIDPGTIPERTPVTPETSPALEVSGTAEALVVRAEAVDPSVLIEYHLSTDPAFVPTLGDLSTRVGTPTRATVFVATGTPDGELLKAGTTYYLRAIAYNEAGAAAPSPAVAGQLDPTALTELFVARLVAGFVLAGGIQVGNILIDPSGGITIPQPGGQAIKFPADGTAARISGALYAFALVVEGGLSLRGTTNLFEAGSKVVLSGGVVAPTQAPTPGRKWDSVASVHTSGDFSNVFFGLAPGAVAGEVVTAAAFFGGRLSLLNTTTGAETATSAGFSDWAPSGGVTRIGTSYYALGVDNSGSGRWFVKRFNNSLAETGEWEYTNESSGDPRQPAIGTDGTNVLIARANTNGGTDRIVVRKYAPGTGVEVSGSVVVCDLGGNAKSNLRSVYQGDYDQGTGRFIVSTETTIYVFTSAGNRLPTAEWTRAGGARVRGLFWDGTRFRQIDDTARLWQYGTVKADTSRSIDFAWYDSDTGGTGVHETNRGPSVTYTQLARSLLTVQTPTPNDTGEPDAPDSVRIWIGGQRQADLGAGVITATYDTPSTGTTTKAASFATAGLSAARVESASGSEYLDGTGGGVWNLTRIRTSDEVALTAASSTFACNLKVRRVGNMVTLFNTAQRPASSSPSFLPVTTIPAGYRPAGTLLLPAATHWNSTITYQYQVESTGVVSIRMSGASTNGMGCFVTYVTDDPWP